MLLIFIEDSRTLLERLGFPFKIRSLEVRRLQSLFALCEVSLQLPNLREQRRTDFRCELDVVNAVGGYISGSTRGGCSFVGGAGS